MATVGLSSDLSSYIRNQIGEAKSKEEEDKYVSQDLEKIKDEISKSNHTDKKIWELILRIIYADILGHNTSFAQAFIVNSVQNPNYRVKRISYLACILLLEEDSPFRIMMVASIQKDMVNPCLYNKLISLNAMTRIICPINASAFSDVLMKQLLNPQPIVKKKAMLALIRLEDVLPGSVEQFSDHAEKALRDGDPSIMMAVLPFYFEQIKKDPFKFKHLLEVFVKVLQQILDHKLSKEFEYDGHGAPWSIVKLLQILRCLASKDKVLSEKLYPFLEGFLKGFNVLMTDMDAVLLYQGILTALQIFPREDLINLCVEKTELLEKSPVMKRQDKLYLILRIIFRLADVGKGHIANYQLLLLDCLDSSDETLRQNTIEILFKTISSQNLELICGKVHEFILSSNDVQIRRNTVEKFFELLEQRAPSPSWFLKKSLTLLNSGPQYVPMSVVNGLLSNIREIISSDEAEETKDEFLSIFQHFFEANSVNDCSVQVFAWFLGEFGHELNFNSDRESYLLSTFEYLLSQTFEQSSATKNFIFTALSKLKTKLNSADFSQQINKMLIDHKDKKFSESNLRIKEYVAATSAATWQQNSGKLDLSLSFLDAFVRKSVFKGGKVYNSEGRTKLSKPVEQKQDVLVTKYTKEQIEQNMKKTIQTPEGGDFVYKGKAKWGKAGYAGEQAASESEGYFGSNNEQKKEGQSYVGMNNDDVGPVRVSKEQRKKMDEQTSKDVQSNNKKESLSGNQPLKFKDQRGQQSGQKGRRDGHKSKIASSLFGQSENLFSEISQPKNGFFGSATTNAARKESEPTKQASTSRKSSNNEKPNKDANIFSGDFLSDNKSESMAQRQQKVPKKSDHDLDLLNMGTSATPAPSNPTSTQSKAEPQTSKPVQTSAISQKPVALEISLATYESLWENLEGQEHEENLSTKLTFEELQKKVRGVGFQIIETMESEIVCAAKNQANDQPGLLYASLESGSLHLISRGDTQVRKAVLSTFK